MMHQIPGGARAVHAADFPSVSVAHGTISVLALRVRVVVLLARLGRGAG